MNHLWWKLTRTEYWTALIQGRWQKFQTVSEALEAACNQVLQSNLRVDVHYAWWYDADPCKHPYWVIQGAYEAQEVFEFATGRRSKPYFGNKGFK